VTSLLLAAALVYRINPAKAEAGFDLKATMHTVHGKTTRVTGEVTVDEAPDGAMALSGRIEVGAASLDTGNSSRDKTMHGESLDVVKYPLIVLVPQQYDPKTGTLTGALTIRDVTRPVSIAAKLDRPAADRIVVTGTFEVPWLEFGVPDPSFAIVRVEKTASAHFSAEFARVSP
jgi:polyisoprenoid-binding protein YceI